MYPITNYTKQRARELGVIVKPSTRKDKKIDIFRDDKKVASVGAYGMNDYPTWLRLKGHSFAAERRRLYKIRHDKTRHVKGSPSWYADKLLW